VEIQVGVPDHQCLRILLKVLDFQVIQLLVLDVHLGGEWLKILATEFLFLRLNLLLRILITLFLLSLIILSSSHLVVSLLVFGDLAILVLLIRLLAGILVLGLGLSLRVEVACLVLLNLVVLLYLVSSLLRILLPVDGYTLTCQATDGCGYL